MFKGTAGSKMLLPIFLLLLLVGVGAGIVLAGQSGDGETGYENPNDKRTISNEEEVSGNEPGPQQGDFLSNGEGQPDTAAPAFQSDEVEVEDSPESSAAQFFKFGAGSNFQPRDSDTTFSYFGGGCVQRDSNVGDSWFTIDLQVPEGAMIDFLRVYYYDNSANYDINSELWVFDAAGGTTMIAEADSSGTPGYSSAGSGFFDHTVDNLNENLVIVASLQGGVGSSLALCGYRIRYEYTLVSANFLPAVLNLTAP
jgi:hypothetical protein